jgi:hypothetical protein
MGKKTTQVGEASRYQDICGQLGHDLKATACVLIVVDGRLGNGLCVAIDPSRPNARDLAHGGGLAAMLRNMADVIEGGEQPAGVGFMTFDPAGEA